MKKYTLRYKLYGFEFPLATSTPNAIVVSYIYERTGDCNVMLVRYSMATKRVVFTRERFVPTVEARNHYKLLQKIGFAHSKQKHILEKEIKLRRVVPGHVEKALLRLFDGSRGQVEYDDPGVSGRGAGL